MNDGRIHLTDEQVFSVIDGDVDPIQRQALEAHLAGCASCRARFDSTANFDRVVSRMPLASVGPSFTESVLRKAGILPAGESSSRFIQFGAGIFGLFVLAMATVAVLAVLGSVEALPAAESSSPSSPVHGFVSAAINAASVELGRFLREYFPFLFGAKSLWSSLSVLGALLVLLMLEPVVSRRLMHREQ
jgi:anti-sigma factor RsiW